MDKNLEKYVKAMKNKTILKGVVKIATDQEMILDLGGYKGIVPKVEAEYSKEWKSLIGFVGREISYIVTAIDEEKKVLTLSRRAAQEKSIPLVIEKLEDGESVIGKVVNFVPYGAFVEIEGGVVGLLKDSGFATDYTKIKEILQEVGSEIAVKLKNLSQKGDFYEFEFEAVDKYTAPTILNLDFFEVGQIVSGEVKKVISNGMFVQIAPGLDALCSIPALEEYQAKDKVKVKISKIIPEEGKIRGKVISENGIFQML